MTATIRDLKVRAHVLETIVNLKKALKEKNYDKIAYALRLLKGHLQVNQTYITQDLKSLAEAVIDEATRELRL